MRVSRERLFALRRGRRSEPGGERVGKPQIRAVSHPGDIAVGPNQHRRGRRDRAKYRKLPHPTIFSVDHLNPIRPGSDVEATRLAEVEEYRTGLVQQREDA